MSTRASIGDGRLAAVGSFPVCLGAVAGIADATRAADRRVRRHGRPQGWSAGANLLYRWQPKWVSAFVVGGAFFAQQRWSTRNGAIGGAIAGFLLGYVASCALDEGCYPEFGIALAGFGAGAGGLIGALIDWKNAGAHIIYALKRGP